MTKRNTFKLPLRRLILLLAMLLCGCSASESCPVTKPVWTVPPDDPAVSGTPGYGYYIMNDDRSIWAAPWWEGQDENYLISGEDIKAGWFRPAGTELEISGKRLDGASPRRG